jgi:hypothetical protein
MACRYMYVYEYVCMYKMAIGTCMYMNMYVCICTCMYTLGENLVDIGRVEMAHRYMYVFACVCMYLYVYVHVYIRNVCACMMCITHDAGFGRSPNGTYAYTCIHMHIHTCTHDFRSQNGI